MDKRRLLDAIAQSGFSLSDECVGELIKASRIRRLEKLDTLVREGQHSDKAFFIIQGSARAYYLKDGKDITDWFAFEHDFISSINSFYQGVASPHFIEVLEPSVLLEVSKDVIVSLSEKYREFDRLEKQVVTQTMLRLQERIASVQFESAQQKYLNLLKIRPDIVQRVPLTHIASYLGITLETLSRIRRKRI